MSNREYMTRLEWLNQQWDEPDRGDYYLMQIAREVRQVLATKSVGDIEKFRIRYTLASSETSKSSTEKLAASKYAWGGILGKKPE